MAAFTSSLFGSLINKWKRAQYASSYSRAGRDKEVMAIAEEGIDTYLNDLEEDLR